MVSKNMKYSTHNKLRLAHHRVKMKNPASTRHAILLALVSNPHAINAAPIKEEPRYPAGNVTDGCHRPKRMKWGSVGTGAEEVPESRERGK